MKELLFSTCILLTGVVFGESNIIEPSTHHATKLVSICQGHKMTDMIDGRLETAKRIKKRWDEEASYERSIKEHKSEMYREDDEWIIEYSWTHVDNCPKCNKQITMEVPVE